MYIPRSIMLLVIGVLLLFPGVQAWVGDVGSSWYRPHLVWLAVIILALVLQQLREPDES